ncbi:unnamed protein product [Acanthocheilonema viteae]|uniref:Phosphatidylcholine transfer protein n=1 Tax=Acanthocheilonema viteae TaxID=6277 RepID=A0A498SYH6_ACAVI|nr:unnamed protein product [Acanthocheilonema viteae]
MRLYIIAIDFSDITASDFVDAQMDLVFRKKWDTNVEKLELVRKDDDTDSELIHWVSKFPYPLYPREYVFVRRRYIDEKDRCIVIANCAIADSANIIPRCEKKYVRVETYRSIMIVRAHKTFECKGFDYILSYYDNPESNIPKYAYNWLVNYGGPYYLHQVHDAAKKLEQKRMEMSINTAETVGVSSKASNDERNGEQEINSMTETEPRSMEGDSKTVNTADEFEILPANVRLYDEKLISSPFENMEHMQHHAIQTQNFYRRKLPPSCINFASPEGKKLFIESLVKGHANIYFRLASHFLTQNEPSYCGLSTLVMVLNALEVDPGRVWKSPWRFYHESMLDCCVPLDDIKKTGITLSQFACLAECNRLCTELKYAESKSEFLNTFRENVKRCMAVDDTILVVSYNRQVLGQTGTGHFSPLGAYHEESDQILIMDVARFKYPPHWVPLTILRDAMLSIDATSGKPRGYLTLKFRSHIQPLVLLRLQGDISAYKTLVNI